ncbi:nuclear transport factor 2 family protein [Collimonas humicola]|uniref:nuclear transport factor 2 family protein n=1 Tax=Collimonas humicola TaxID=2825886 RepID=UPI001B8CF68C|nr:nuclear transport factor 2 family protein [Collimonas humicola]
MFKKLMFLCSAMICSIVIAQGAAAAPANDEQMVADVVERLRAAMNHPGDGGALKPLVMDELSYGHSNGKVQDKAEFIEALVSGASNFVSIALSDQSIRIVQDTAVVRHTFVAVTNDSGKPGNVALKILMVWKKHDGHWRLLARQAVRFNA